MTNSENKTCQNCKNQFTIEPEDFEFYHKIKVPPPTWCPECQLRRRLVYRNERSLYKRKDTISGKEIIAMYPPDTSLIVYTHDYWWSDAWDAMQYGQEYDFTKPFFEQFQTLIKKTPWPAMFNWNSVNSSYCNFSTDNKNCYLVFGGDFNENCLYSKFNFHSRDSLDLYWVEKGELCYEDTDCEAIYNVAFSQYTYNSSDCSFLFDCTNCNHCLGCVGLRNKSYCILNQQYTKETYEEKIKSLRLGSFSGLKEFAKQFNELKIKFPRRYAVIIKSTDSTGNNIYNAKKCESCFDVHDNTEDAKDVFLAGWGVKDILHVDHVGHGVELIYESSCIFSGSSRVFFSILLGGCRDTMYSYNCTNSSNMFGCVGLRNKQYCILNKQYSKEEYESLLPKIIEQMQTMFYTDSLERIYKYGEFFPPEISPFAYNETIALEDMPLVKEEALRQGYAWKDLETKDYNVTKKSEDLPDDIKDVKDDILKDVIECAYKGDRDKQCTVAFRIVPQELELYHKLNFPLPRLCHNCRYYNRLKQRNSYKLWHRQCQCIGAQSENGIYTNIGTHPHGSAKCPNEFETTYEPERPEIIYCESCYQNEII